MKMINFRTIFQILTIVLLISCNKKSNNYYNCPITLEPIGFLNSICEIEEKQKNDSLLASFSKYGIFIDSSNFIIKIQKKLFK